MDFGNSKHWEAFIREAEKAIAAANERRSQLSPSSEDAMDEYADLWDDINQYKTAIKIAQLAIKVCSDDDPQPAPVETPRFKVGSDVVYRHESGLRYTGLVTGRADDGRWIVSLDTVNETIVELADDQLEPAD